jgi:polyisoprenoid-binding protein YceI
MKLLLVSTAAAALLTGAALAQDDRGLSSIAAGTYEIDKTHGYVTFSYSHLGYSNPILRFDDVDATVTLDPQDPAQSTLEVMIDPASINTGVEKFDEHLKSADFFTVDEYDSITFESTSIELENGYSGTLTGNLTIKDVTRPVTLDVTLNKAAEHPMQGVDAFGITATGQVMRSEFDLGAYVPNVGDEVDILIEAEFHKTQE